MRLHCALGLSIFCTLTACDGSDYLAEGRATYVYDKRMTAACNFEENISLDESSSELASLGIDVIASHCAELTNIVMTEACFDLTGEFYIHKIRPENITDLTQSSYREIDDLQNHEFPERYVIGEGGVSYSISECSD